MRNLVVIVLGAAALAGCVTTGGDYPRVRYARAAEAGPVAMQLAGRPGPAEIDQAEDRWGRAIADSYSCRLDALAVSEAAMVGALELAAMSAASRGAQSPFDGVVNYASAFGRHAVSAGPAPGADRCRRLAGWVSDVRREGRGLLLRGLEAQLLPPR